MLSLQVQCIRYKNWKFSWPYCGWLLWNPARVQKPMARLYDLQLCGRPSTYQVKTMIHCDEVLHVPIDDDLTMTWYLLWMFWEWQWWWMLLALGVCVCVAPGVQVCIHCNDWSALHCSCIFQFTALSLKDEDKMAVHQDSIGALQYILPGRRTLGPSIKTNRAAGLASSFSWL